MVTMGPPPPPPPTKKTTTTKKMDEGNDEEDVDSFRIALYYCYTRKPIEDREKHISFQNQVCIDLELKGRIRVSSEGINGVLSGKKMALETYERMLREELIQLMRMNSNSSGDEEDALQREEDEESNHDKHMLLGGRHYGEELDIKYCHLRRDIPLESQLFSNLSVKCTKEVISLIGQTMDPSVKKKGTRRRRRLRQKPKPNTHNQNNTIATTTLQPSNNNNENSSSLNANDGVALEQIQYHHHLPAQHVSPEKWNKLLSSFSKDHHNPSSQIDQGAILIDARNIYESRLGHFKIPGVPTLLTNTRKYSALPSVLDASIPHLAGKNIFMYCTGGVRCERASMYLQALSQTDRWDNFEKPKAIYQLQGGIQRYLEKYGSTTDNNTTSTSTSTSTSTTSTTNTSTSTTLPETHDTHTNDDCIHQTKDYDTTLVTTLPPDPTKENNHDTKHSNSNQNCLFKGRNFVFDQRRIDPVIGPDSPAQCIMCSCQHYDYDNGHAPSDNKEARCCRCRILVLVCNTCRTTVRSWGEEESMQPDLFCGPHGKTCIDQGNSLENAEII